MIQTPEALLWDHNAHYHRWVLRQVPAGTARAFDAGCGDGALARRLAVRVPEVYALDVSPVMIERARSLSTATTNIHWLTGDVLDHHGHYDLVTAVSSLHHLPLRPAVERLADLVRPGGRLLVVGLYVSRGTDYLVDLAAVPAGLMVGAYLAVRGRAGKPHDHLMPVRDPEDTLDDVRRVAAQLLPGAVIRRRLFFRFTLQWTKS